ncbi:hypothetical protein Hanom_Chr17g01534401 [Helianthus anomalus]
MSRMWMGLNNVILTFLLKSKLPFWSLRFGHFCHFSPKLKLFASGSLWFQFCCHFDPKARSAEISQKNPIFCPFPQFNEGQNGHFPTCPPTHP